MNTFDYIVIGSGSSGSALAYRLLEDGKNTVAVIENGGNDSSPLIQMPAALSFVPGYELFIPAGSSSAGRLIHSLTASCAALSSSSLSTFSKCR